MADLFWPGDERAGEVCSDRSLLRAMVRVESAWLAALADAGIAEQSGPLEELIDDQDVTTVASGADAGGNPVIPLLSLLRERTGPATAKWLHRGLTSQDVLDTALMLCLAEARSALREQLRTQGALLGRLADTHRNTVQSGRTLAQHAVPITFGLKAAMWLQGVLDADDELAGLALPGQFGGAAGTLAAPVELAYQAGHNDPVRAATELGNRTCWRLGLAVRPPWHTSRAPVTRTGDGFVRCTDAFGRIAADVLTLSRPEIAELAEPQGGSSSTMPQKANPVGSVLVRRAALAAPQQAAQLHLAASQACDERPDGAWHTEWAALRTLARHAVVAASHTTELLDGLRVDPNRMRANTELGDLHGEARSVAALFGGTPHGDYLGATGRIIDEILERAQAKEQA